MCIIVISIPMFIWAQISLTLLPPFLCVWMLFQENIFYCKVEIEKHIKRMHGLMYCPKVNNLFTTIRPSKVYQKLPPTPSSLLPPNSLHMLHANCNLVLLPTRKNYPDFYSNYSLTLFMVLSVECQSLGARLSPLDWIYWGDTGFMCTIL